MQVVVALPGAVRFQITTYVEIGNPCFRSLSKWTNAKNGKCFSFVEYSGLCQVIHLSVAMSETT